MKKRGINFNVRLSNHALYSMITLLLIAIVGVGVYAYANPTTGIGHEYTDIKPCAAGETLQVDSTTHLWKCVAFPSGGSGGGSTTTLNTNLITINSTSTDTLGSSRIRVENSGTGGKIESKTIFENFRKSTGFTSIQGYYPRVVITPFWVYILGGVCFGTPKEYIYHTLYNTFFFL